jgi:hypothetical protein
VQYSLRLTAPPYSEPKVLLYGSAGDTRNRTWFSITAIMAMPILCRGTRPFMVYPFTYPDDYIKEINAASLASETCAARPQHAIHIALDWKARLAADRRLTMAQIARQQRLSRARVTQIMNLMRLPPAIIKELRMIATLKEARRFSERALREILLLRSPAEQLVAFRKLRDTASDRRDADQQKPRHVPHLVPESHLF